MIKKTSNKAYMPILHLIIILMVVGISAPLKAVEYDPQLVEQGEKFFKDNDACNQISVNSLCAKKIKTLCLDADTISGDCVTIDNLTINDLNVQNSAYLQQLCTGSHYTQYVMSSYSVDSDNVSANTLSVSGTGCFNAINVTSACIGNLSANDVCISGTLQIGCLQSCAQYLATAVFSDLTTYTLGEFIDFDVILSDPNNDIILTPTFGYIAPLSGTYVITLQIDQQNLNVFDGSPVLGVPVSNPQIFINGTVFRQSYVPYLTFFNQQKTTLTSLLDLKQGDLVQCVFDVLALNQTNGIIPISGTVNILGNGTQANQSVFKIALLNVDCVTIPSCSACPQACTASTVLTCTSVCSQPTPCTSSEPCTTCSCF